MIYKVSNTCHLWKESREPGYICDLEINEIVFVFNFVSQSYLKVLTRFGVGYVYSELIKKVK